MNMFVQGVFADCGPNMQPMCLVRAERRGVTGPCRGVTLVPASTPRDPKSYTPGPGKINKGAAKFNLSLLPKSESVSQEGNTCQTERWEP
ncbi:hypothetical protein SKAU_G00361040 [Synaphobranchus kaupii]|uniref:Uncharacterized protein n=1 Tax=Synaphobranchus kaupii TaxID=118154 RepID=A0A9Q1EID2_SYNKA|nr:hypothetical protein SKAU_G00361040 [Synaphobranchus kaupii]